MHVTPIAVTGIGCRFPGQVHDVETFWRLLMDGVDAIADIPPDRWLHARFYHPDSSKEQRTPQAQGGFVSHIDGFDPGFFGISPREAASLDPQHRLLLEVAWEALEDAGYPLDRIAGTRMGVFTGASSHDYIDLQDLDSLSTHSVTGWALCMTSNRLSYAFDLQGPSFTIDTACSSALVALHQAVTSLQRQESDTALVCGVNALLHPMHHVAFSRLSMLSPTSRCHAFDASGDGYVRSEGAGVLVLKPLERARADGDRIYATILRTVVNSDGHNEGLTMPSVEGQIRLLRDAYRGLPIEQVRYVEAHGTGTAAGDPVEATALGTVLQHPARRLQVGSVKTNIGHLEAGAGMAGLIKTCLMAWKRQIPANLHFTRPNPSIPFEALGIDIPTTSSPLPAHEVLLGVNSFGFGGTNGHAVLSTPPLMEARPSSAEPASQLICLSARSVEALQDLRRRYQDLGPTSLRDIAYSSLERRSHHPYRTAVVAEHLSDLDSAETHAPVRQRPRVAFVYSGQGSQWLGMGRTLLADPVFSAFLDECEPHYRTVAGWSVREAFERDTSVDKTALVQPLLFALQAGLTRMLAAWGVEPDAVLGHSVGEVAAAWAAGALGLADAIHLVVHRGRLMDRDSSRGRMIAVDAAPDTTMPYLQAGVCIAAINSPRSVTLSGASDAVEAVVRRLRDAGLDCTDVKVDYAFHSAQLDVLREDLAGALQGLSPTPPTRTMISTVTGGAIQILDGAYWWKNVREPVRFADAVAWARANEMTLFLEIGGHPVLGASITEGGGLTIPTLRRHQPERRAFLQALADLYCAGLDLSWGDGPPPQWIPLPHYPWQRERYWQEARRTRIQRLSPSRYAMLGHQNEKNIFTQVLSPLDPSWIKDHQLHDQTIVSASTMMEMGFEAAHARQGRLPLVLDHVHLDSACFVTTPTVMQTVVHDDGTLTIYSESSDGAEERRTVARAHIAADPGAWPAPLDLAAIEARLPTFWLGSLSERWAARGLRFGPSFDAMQSGRLGFHEALAQVRGACTLADADGLSFTHPGTIDACFQVGLAALDQEMMGDGATWLPVSARRVRLLRPLEEDLVVHARCTRQTAREVLGDVTVCNRQGEVLFDMQDYRLVRAADSSNDALDALCYSLQWVACPLENTEPRPGHWLVFSDGGRLAATLVSRLEADGNTVDVVAPGDRFDLRDVGEVVGCLHLCSLSATLDDPAAPLMPLLYMVQQAEEHDLRVPRLWCVSRRCQPAGDVSVQPEGSPVWGLVRVLATEEPWLHPTLVDIEDDATDADAVYRELSSRNPEEVAYRQGQRYVHRCQRLPLSHQVPRPETPRPGRDYVLTCERPGTLEALQWTVPESRDLAADEVRVAVAASGLNFSDVMRVLGLYPTDGVLGIEMAGTVTEVGAAVRDLQPGDRVMGIAPSGFASHVTLPRAFLVPTPPSLTDVQAAGMPLVFLTASYALTTLGRLKARDTILVHAATGGLGQAAIQIARQVGARVMATAGSPEKVAFLRKQGIEHVFDSRSTAFVDDVLRVTDGAGVDVVLNSLAGEALTGGLSILRRFGRFLDVTKRDIYADMRVGLSPFRHSLSYHAIDLEQVMNHDPDTVQDLLQRLVADIQAGTLAPLPTQTWPYRQAVEAFRCMSQARHVGKVVLVAEPPDEVQPSWKPVRNGTYVVTGGLGGFGREVVLWLLAHGAGRVAVLTRTPKAHVGFDDPRVATYAVDVGDGPAVAALFSTLGSIRGVVHAAMQLDDVPTLNLTRDRLQGVFRAKIDGAWNLHQATLTQPIDFFIMFSSNAAWFGSAGQGNYSAANAFLDSLAFHRRALRKPALVINWGPLGDVGYLARNPQVAAWLEAGGSKTITSRQALQALERALGVNPTQVGVMHADWALLLKAMRGKPVARFEALMAANRGGTEAGVNLENLDAGERRAALHPLVLAQVARVLGTTSQRIDSGRSLSDMGLDSLMSLQIRNWVKSTLNVTLSANTLLSGPSLDELVDLLATALQRTVDTPTPAETVLDHLEDEELEAMIGALLVDTSE